VTEAAVADRELLRAVYRAIAWDRLYELAPGATREEVDGLFRRFQETLAPSPAASASPAGALPRSVLYCDGASSGNPGPAAIGVVLSRPDGSEVESWGRPIGRATSNVAEYKALIEGLGRALELGVREVEVASDSQLLVYQLTGRYKVKHATLRELYGAVRELLGRFERWSVRHASREETAQADRLARSQLKKSAAAEQSLNCHQ